MIQRIQSIYLFLAAVAMFGLYLFPIAHNVYVGGKATTIEVTGLLQDMNGVQAHTQSFTALTIVTAIVALLPLALIFLFRDRKMQINLCYAVIAVIIGHSYWLAQTVKNTTDGLVMRTDNFGIGLFLPPIAILLILLAIKAIKNDEKLVKSADRLR
jgi:hypothetical protein